MKTEKIYKQLSYSLKDIDTDKRTVAFYFNKFMEYDSDDDRIFPGAGKKTRTENRDRIKHLYNHWKTIGKPLMIDEDTNGDFMVSKLGRDTDSNDVYLKYQDGLITEHSFGFEGINPVENERGGRDFKEYKLWEASSLDLWGAQKMTPVISVKSIEPRNIEMWTDRLQKLSKAVRKGYSDETAEELENQLMIISEFLKNLSTQPDRKDTTEPRINYLNVIEKLNIKIQ